LKDDQAIFFIVQFCCDPRAQSSTGVGFNSDDPQNRTILISARGHAKMPAAFSLAFVCAAAIPRPAEGLGACFR
jgi:hypothetical protein